MNRSASLYALAVGVAGLPALGAIVGRHDVDDDAYVELAQKYTMVGSIGGATCTLIDPLWVLTAAHVADSVSPFTKNVVFGDNHYPIEAIVIHPTWETESNDGSAIDIALIKLARPVEGIKPVHLYRGNDEVGMEVVFVGRGMQGNGLTGPTAEDGRKRAATNTVEQVPVPGWISFRFDAPDDGALDMEGISGPGDSGGPALVEIDGKLYTIGVSASNDPLPGKESCTYGSMEYYPRVSTAAGWIDSSMRGAVAPRQVPEITDISAEGWPQSRGGEIASAFFEAFSQNDAKALRGFESRYRSEAALAARGVELRAEAWHSFRPRWGELKPLRCTTQGDKFVVLVDSEIEGKLTFGFQIEQDSPNKLGGVFIAPHK